MPLGAARALRGLELLAVMVVGGIVLGACSHDRELGQVAGTSAAAAGGGNSVASTSGSSGTTGAATSSIASTSIASTSIASTSTATSSGAGGGTSGAVGSSGNGGASGTGGSGPVDVVFTGLSATAHYPDGISSPLYEDACPRGQALWGFMGTLDGDFGKQFKIEGICGDVLVSGVAPYTLTVSPSVTLGPRGMLPPGPGSGWIAACPANQFVVGFGGTTSDQVNNLYFQCAPLVVSAGQAPFTITTGAVTFLAGAGTGGGMHMPETSCPSGQVATMSRINADDRIRAFGLGCSVPSFD